MLTTLDWIPGAVLAIEVIIAAAIAASAEVAFIVEATDPPIAITASLNIGRPPRVEVGATQTATVSRPRRAAVVVAGVGWFNSIAKLRANINAPKSPGAQLLIDDRIAARVVAIMVTLRKLNHNMVISGERNAAVVLKFCRLTSGSSSKNAKSCGRFFGFRLSIAKPSQ
jgi:hypothetical protein